MIPKNFTSEDHRLADLGFWVDDEEFERFRRGEIPLDPVASEWTPPSRMRPRSLLYVGLVGVGVFTLAYWAGTYA